MQPDAPEWLNELLHPYCANSPMVAAVVWAAITERVKAGFETAPPPSICFHEDECREGHCPCNDVPGWKANDDD